MIAFCCFTRSYFPTFYLFIPSPFFNKCWLGGGGGGGGKGKDKMAYVFQANGFPKKVVDLQNKRSSIQEIR